MRPAPRVLLAHPGTQHSHRLAHELAARNLLGEFWTGFAIHKEGTLAHAARSLLPETILRRLSSRIIDGIPISSLRTLPWIELMALSRLRCGTEAEKVLHERNRRFQEAIPPSAFQGISAVIGFDTAAWILTRRARHAEIPFILDRSIAFSAIGRRDTNPHARLFPEWSDGAFGEHSGFLELQRREHAEATCIVSASSFTRRTLVDSGVDPTKIVTIPYGVDANAFQPSTGRPSGSKVRFLFVGAIGARKGVPVLLQAWAALSGKGGELTLVGPVHPKDEHLLGHRPHVKILGKRPHIDLPAIFAEHDVFVFPSLFEGFGLVILEAMASGLPVITTDATAGPDVISEGEDGFVVPAGDPEALRDRMAWSLENPRRINEMGRAARETARRYSWERYGQAWERLLVPSPRVSLDT